MPPRKIDLTPSDDQARRRLQSFRRMRDLTLAELSRALQDIGHPLSVSTLSQIENGGRRMFVGDVVALAAALNVRARVFVEEGPRQGDGWIPDDLDSREALAALLPQFADMQARLQRLESGQPEPTQRPEGPGMNEVTPEELGMSTDGTTDGDR